MHLSILRRWAGIIGLVACTIIASACSGGPRSPVSASQPRVSTPGIGTTSTSLEPGPTTSSTVQATTTSTAAPGGSGPSLVPGAYVDGTSSTPHYVVEITSSPPGTLDGTLIFVLQDGKQRQVFTFTSTPGAGTFALSTDVASDHPTAAISGQALTLPGCQQYLSYALSPSACTFAAG